MLFTYPSVGTLFSYRTSCHVVLISSVRCTAGVALNRYLVLTQMYVNCVRMSNALLTISSVLLTLCVTCCKNRKLHSATQYICAVHTALKINTDYLRIHHFPIGFW